MVWKSKPREHLQMSEWRELSIQDGGNSSIMTVNTLSQTTEERLWK
jgi:hypothetical protein